MSGFLHLTVEELEIKDRRKVVIARYVGLSSSNKWYDALTQRNKDIVIARYVGLSSSNYQSLDEHFKSLVNVIARYVGLSSSNGYANINMYWDQRLLLPAMSGFLHLTLCPRVQFLSGLIVRFAWQK